MNAIGSLDLRYPHHQFERTGNENLVGLKKSPQWAVFLCDGQFQPTRLLYHYPACDTVQTPGIQARRVDAPSFDPVDIGGRDLGHFTSFVEQKGVVASFDARLSQGGGVDDV